MGLLVKLLGVAPGRTSTHVMPSLMLPVRILSLARMVPQMTPSGKSLLSLLMSRMRPDVRSRSR